MPYHLLGWSPPTVTVDRLQLDDAITTLRRISSDMRARLEASRTGIVLSHEHVAQIVVECEEAIAALGGSR